MNINASNTCVEILLSETTVVIKNEINTEGKTISSFTLIAHLCIVPLGYRSKIKHTNVGFPLKIFSAVRVKASVQETHNRPHGYVCLLAPPRK